MGSILSKINDDYDDYVAFCIAHGIRPIDSHSINPTFYQHWKTLEAQPPTPEPTPAEC